MASQFGAFACCWCCIRVSLYCVGRSACLLCALHNYSVLTPIIYTVLRPFTTVYLHETDCVQRVFFRLTTYYGVFFVVCFSQINSYIRFVRLSRCHHKSSSMSNHIRRTNISL